MSDSLGREPASHYAHFEELRKARERLLKPGERWLTPKDSARKGDSYLGSTDETYWWPLPVGKIALDYFCYTPKGKRS